MVFDTMVLVYALLGVTEFHHDSLAAIRKAEEIWAPDLLRAELLNALWQWTRARKVSPDIAGDLFQSCASLVRFAPADGLQEVAFRLALDRDHSPYDTLFVALAISREQKLLTYDRGLLGKFPEWTLSVPDFLGEAAH
jgi:predicted nucleic acid-binding protein